MIYQQLMLYTPARYRIRVKGYLRPSWAKRLGGIITIPSGEADAASVLALVGIGY